MTPRLATAALTATFALALAASPQADASAVQTYSYSTEGSIANQAGVAPIYLNGTSGQSMTTPGTFSLGQFDAAATLPASATLTYNNTAFTIDLNVISNPGNPNMASSYEYVISGVLNGSITGAGFSNMVATVTSITGVPEYSNGVLSSAPFPISDLSINVPQGIVAPNTATSTDGIANLYAQVNVQGLGNPTPTPEPTSIAAFGVALAGGWFARRRARSRA